MMAVDFAAQVQQIEAIAGAPDYALSGTPSSAKRPCSMPVLWSHRML
ncbi:MAG: hypothetical protein QOI26_1678 [Pseudonocardiales bacterium]|jgi:hypothetical protein|nr:hypothetical protein [Pseudonocardiales bacterium]